MRRLTTNQHLTDLDRTTGATTTLAAAAVEVEKEEPRAVESAMVVAKEEAKAKEDKMA